MRVLHVFSRVRILLCVVRVLNYAYGASFAIANNGFRMDLSVDSTTDDIARKTPNPMNASLCSCSLFNMWTGPPFEPTNKDGQAYHTPVHIRSVLARFWNAPRRARVQYQLVNFYHHRLYVENRPTNS